MLSHVRVSSFLSRTTAMSDIKCTNANMFDKNAAAFKFMVRVANGITRLVSYDSFPTNQRSVIQSMDDDREPEPMSNEERNER